MEIFWESGSLETPLTHKQNILLDNPAKYIIFLYLMLISAGLSTLICMEYLILDRVMLFRPPFN